MVASVRRLWSGGCDSVVWVVAMEGESAYGKFNYIKLYKSNVNID